MYNFPTANFFVRLFTFGLKPDQKYQKYTVQTTIMGTHNLHF